MFDNIIGQSRLLEQIKLNLHENNLSPSMLFWGPDYSGKLTVALELARVLSCEKMAQWNCDCHACNVARRLLYPYTVMLGNRYFDLEIDKSAQSLLADPSSVGGRFFYLRSVRKLLRRFDPFLWEDDDSRYKKAKNLIAPIEELLEPINPLIPETLTDAKLEKLLKNVGSKTSELAAILDGYSTSIGQVRSLNHWARNNAQSIKVVIIEQADKMQEGARNALLKILEEPPQRLYFILISRSRTAIMPTILSRVRPYAFAERTAEEESEVLSRVFKTAGSGLKDFFAGSLHLDIKGLAKAFYEGKKHHQSFIQSYPGKILDDHFVRFLEELTLIIRDEFQNRAIDTYQAEDYMALISILKNQYTIYKQSPQTLAEQFFYN